MNIKYFFYQIYQILKVKVTSLSEGPELIFEYSFDEGNICKYHIGNIKHQSGVIVRTQELVFRTKPVNIQGI